MINKLELADKMFLADLIIDEETKAMVEFEIEPTSRLKAWQDVLDNNIHEEGAKEIKNRIQSAINGRSR